MRISVQSLRKTYHDAQRELVVLDNLTYDFETGKSYAIVGRSGIGKSTLLHLLGGLDRPTKGKVIYDETDLYSKGSDDLAVFRGQNVGFIFQFHHLLPEFSAFENVAMPLIIAGAEESRIQERAGSLLESVGLTDRASHRPGELSGGEQQRVAIARALVINPRAVLADEPTGNLDVTTAGEVQELLLNICKSNGTTLIVVTHNRELSKSLDHALEMEPGGALRKA